MAPSQVEWFSSAHVILLLAAVLGTFLSWVAKRWHGTTIGGPFQYLYANPWTTISMFAATAAACGGIILAGTLKGMADPYVFWLGFGTGFMCDLAINRGPQPPDAPAPDKGSGK